MYAPVLLGACPVGDAVSPLNEIVVINFDIVVGKLESVSLPLRPCAQVERVVVSTKGLHSCRSNIIFVYDGEYVIHVIVVNLIGDKLASPEFDRKIRRRPIVPQTVRGNRN